MCVCVKVVLQRRLFCKCYGFSSRCGTSGEVIKPVNSTLQTGTSPKAAELCAVSECGAVAKELYLSWGGEESLKVTNTPWIYGIPPRSQVKYFHNPQIINTVLPVAPSHIGANTLCGPRVKIKLVIPQVFHTKQPCPCICLKPAGCTLLHACYIQTWKTLLAWQIPLPPEAPWPSVPWESAWHTLHPPDQLHFFCAQRKMFMCNK